MCVSVVVLEHHNVAVYWRNVVSGGISVVSLSESLNLCVCVAWLSSG